MLNSARLMRDARKQLAAQVKKGVGPEFKDSVLGIIATTKQFEDPNHCWKLSTRCGSLRTVAIARQTIKGEKARVTLRLTLEDGSLVTETESLALTPAGWRIGQITALQNNGLHQTGARRSGPRHSSEASR